MKPRMTHTDMQGMVAWQGKDDVMQERSGVLQMTDGERLKALELLLDEAADELEAEINARYPPELMRYPDSQRRRARDMDLPNRIRAALR